MSDDSDYSDEEEQPQIVSIPISKKITGVGNNSSNLYDDIDDSEPDDDSVTETISDEDQEGGADSELEEGEIREADDAEPELEGDNNVEDDDEDDDNDSDIEINEDGEPVEKSSPSKISKPKIKKAPLLMHDDDGDDEDEYDENYLQKFDTDIVKNYIDEFHPECFNHNYDEIAKLSVVTKNRDGIIIDPLHRTIPYLTKYEKARVLGQRAKQIETGAKPLVKVPETIVDAYIIAELELKEKKIPFIIRRPIPGGGSEYWNLKDLEIITF